MGLNLYYYDGLQPKIRAGIINEHECKSRYPGANWSRLNRTHVDHLRQNHTEDEFQNIINEVEFDHKGKISLNDFLNLMSRKMNEYSRKEEIRETFRAFDKGNTGFIVAAELKVA